MAMHKKSKGAARRGMMKSKGANVGRGRAVKKMDKNLDQKYKTAKNSETTVRNL